jgi:hypothetical protein
MHINKKNFYVFEMRNSFEIFFKFSKKKPGIFNIGSVSYSVNLQPDIW